MLHGARDSRNLFPQSLSSTGGKGSIVRTFCVGAPGGRGVEGGNEGEGATHTAGGGELGARARYGVAQDGEKKGLFDVMAAAEKNEVSIQCCGGDSVEWTAR